ncbi:MAG: choice-of-anchor E domain-containing protein [Isosphaeraceae bacterium]
MKDFSIQRIFGQAGTSRAAGGRTRSCRPGVERLETLRLLASGVLSGHAFLDANANAKWDAGEVAAAGSTVVLKNAQGAVVASTKTDANGLYSFASDPGVVSKTVSLASGYTNYDKAVTLPGFDPSLGVLTSVDVTFQGSITSDVFAENTSISSPSTLTANASGVVSASGPGLDVSLPLNVIDSAFDATTYDGSEDFGGTSGHEFGPTTASGTRTVTVTDPAALAAFAAGGLDVNVSARGQASADGGGSLSAYAVTTASASFTVVYHYTPKNGVSPGNYAVAALDAPAGYKPGASVSVSLDGQKSVQADLADAPTTSQPFVSLKQTAPKVDSASWSAPKGQAGVLTVVFSGDPDPKAVAKLASYKLQAVGADGKLTGKLVGLASVKYDAATHTLTIKTAGALNAKGKFVLTMQFGKTKLAAGFTSGNLSATPAGPAAAFARRGR